MSNENECVYLTYEQAVEMLPEGDKIHTFVGGGFALLGADWQRENVLSLLRDGKPELAGAMATAMGHGIVAWRGGEPIFVETRRQP